MKKFSCITLIVLIFIFSFLAPLCRSESYSYAATIPEGWTQTTSNAELVSAFKAYCKSRNLAIDGSVADAVTSFTTQTFNNICNTLGIDVTALQAEIASKTDGNLGLQWFFTDTGVSAYNRIFAEFLQNNDLSVSDSADETNNTVYSGYMFTDDNGNSCLITITTNANNNNKTFTSNDVSQPGTSFLGGNSVSAYNYWLNNKVSGDVAYNYLPFYKYEHKYDWTIHRNYSRPYYYFSYNSYGYQAAYFATTNVSETDLKTNNMFTTIVMRPNGAIFTACYNPSAKGNQVAGQYFDLISSNYSSSNVYVFLTTNNKTINNNTYEGDTIINNDGTSGSGGGGSDNPSTTPSGSGSGTGGVGTGSDGIINFPDFNFDFPSINWSLGDLSEKFPFSIPFDLVAFFTVLNAEPEAPKIDANIPLGSFYTWHFVADFSQFDNYAVIIRNVEFLAFCIGLIYITIRLVKG